MTAAKKRRGPGRPPVDDPGRTVSIRLSQQLRRRIDAERGKQPLGSWIRDAIESQLRELRNRW